MSDGCEFCVDQAAGRYTDGPFLGTIVSYSACEACAKEHGLIKAPEPARVFCKDCRHRSSEVHFTGIGTTLSIPGKHCQLQPDIELDPVDGEKIIRPLCRVRNAKMDCGLFEPKPPRMPWWRRFLRNR